MNKSLTKIAIVEPKVFPNGYLLRLASHDQLLEFTARATEFTLNYGNQSGDAFRETSAQLVRDSLSLDQLWNNCTNCTNCTWSKLSLKVAVSLAVDVSISPELRAERWWLDKKQIADVSPSALGVVSLRKHADY